jgi:hypothetical protein
MFFVENSLKNSNAQSLQVFFPKNLWPAALTGKWVILPSPYKCQCMSESPPLMFAWYKEVRWLPKCERRLVVEPASHRNDSIMSGVLA